MSIVLTRKSILIEKYTEFQTELKNQGINSSFFPSLEDFDLVDLLFFFEMTFTNSDDYKRNIQDLIKYTEKDQQITEDELNRVYPTIEAFIKYLLIDFKKL